jgi:hypothetical protein
MPTATTNPASFNPGRVYPQSSTSAGLMTRWLVSSPRRKDRIDARNEMLNAWKRTRVRDVVMRERRCDGWSRWP